MWIKIPFYTGCLKKAERRIFSTLRAKSVIFFTSLNKASSTKEHNTKIIKFGWVILVLCPFLETQSYSNFAWFLRPMSVDCVGNGLSYARFRLRCIFCCVGSMGFPKIPYKRPFPIQFYAHRSQKSSEIWKWPCFKKWASNSMNLVSFSFAEYVLFNDVKRKKMTLLACKVLKIIRSAFLGHPVYIFFRPHTIYEVIERWRVC